MRKLLLLAACLMVIAAFASADDKDKKEDKTKSEPTVAPVSLSVSRKLDQKAFPYGTSDMTTLTFAVSVPKKALLGVDLEGSKVEKFEDDKGNSLITDRAFFQQQQVAVDRSSMMVGVFVYNKRPGKGATKLTLKGELSAAYGTEEKSEEMKKVKFEAKATAKAGDFEVTVTQEKGGFGIEGPVFSLKSKTRAIKSVLVKDGDGKELEVQAYGTLGFGDNWTSNYAVKKEVKEGSIKVTYFSKEEKVKVPIDLTVGLDLSR